MSEIEKQDKLAFITKGYDKELKELAKELQEKGIDSTMYYGYFDGLCVDAKDYLKALEYGSEIVEKMNNGRRIFWADYNDCSHNTGYIPVMYAVLPQTRQGDEFWVAYDNPEYGCPFDIKSYFNNLKEYCDIDSIGLKFKKCENGFEVFVKAPFKEHEKLIKKCKTFNKLYGYNPFLETYYTKVDNSIDVNFKNIKENRANNIKTYFYNSLFNDIIRYPRGSNIAPHNDDYKHKYLTYGGYSEISEDSIRIWPGNRMSIQGNFKTCDTKGETFNSNYCTVTDSGDFKTELSFTQDEVVLQTTANASRLIEGIDLDGQNDRDAFFTCLSSNGSEGVVTCTEHFVKIADGTRLLHYSDEFDSFEIFDLPSNWMIERGIPKGIHSKVFDDYEYDNDDQDLAEVKEILNSRKRVLTPSN